ncbi:MAG: hypothetical protein ABIQ64_04620 [Candidatus Saccharimonadales bacterium]
MARLPEPGGDKGAWGAILNEYLAQAHKPDGTLKDGVITTANLAPNAVDESVLGASGGSSGQVLSKDTGSSTGLSWITVSGGAVPDASSSVKGIVQLTGDLGGTATSPTVPGLTSKATDTLVVHLSGSETVTGVKTFSASPVVPTPTLGTQATNKTYVDGVAGAGAPDASSSVKGIVQLTGDLGGTANSPTVPGLAGKSNDSAVVHNTGAETVAGVKTFSSSPIVPTPTTNTQAANKSYVDGVAGAGAPDASPTVKGIVQLTGDLGGTATAPTVAKVNGISVSGTPSTGQVLKATSASAATWQSDATGGGSTWTFTSLSSNTTISAGDYALVDTTSAGVTITLPVAANGAAVRVKRITGGANSVQIVPQAPALIDGSGVGSHVLGNQWDSMEFVSDGTNWYRG